jgi:hypothetical protein
MSKRAQNERRYPNWEDLPGGGRRYWYDRQGAVRGWVRYIKIVDADEQTTSFVQEIFNDDGELVARHQKYPVDTGHEVLKREDE